MNTVISTCIQETSVDTHSNTSKVDALGTPTAGAFKYQTGHGTIPVNFVYNSWFGIHGKPEHLGIQGKFILEKQT